MTASKDPVRVTAALESLVERVVCGWGYSDAHAHVVMKFHVDGTELNEAYDALCFGTSFQRGKA